MRKKVASITVALLMVFVLAVPAFAASNYFSGITGKMNALSNGESAPFNISSGTVPSQSSVSSVSVSVTVSSGSAPLYLKVKTPSGYWAEKHVGSSSGTVTFTEFNGYNPSGTWQVSIRTTGTVSTATARMTVNYNY